MGTEAFANAVLEGTGLLHNVIMGWSDIVDAEIFGVMVSCMLVRYNCSSHNRCSNIAGRIVTIQGVATQVQGQLLVCKQFYDFVVWTTQKVY